MEFKNSKITERKKSNGLKRHLARYSNDIKIFWDDSYSRLKMRMRRSQ